MKKIRFEAILVGLNYWAIYDNKQHISVAYAYTPSQVKAFIDLYTKEPRLATEPEHYNDD